MEKPPAKRPWLERTHPLELTGLEILALSGYTILGLKHPDASQRDAADVARQAAARLCNLIIEQVPPEVAEEWRRVLEEGRDYDADDEACPACGNEHPPGARCELYR